MSKLKYIIIHCTATPEGREVCQGDVEQMHLAPRDLPTGGVRYMGKTYPSRNHLPNHKINGKPIKNLSGRGWRRVGYHYLIQQDGCIVQLHEHNDNDTIEPWEITNGVRGQNSQSIHICYVGGCAAEKPEEARWHPPKDTRTKAQKEAIKTLVKDLLKQFETTQVAGHNQFANKACPSFDVSLWAKQVKIPRRQIYLP